MGTDGCFSLLEIAILLLPAIVLVLVLIGILTVQVLRRPDTAELQRLTARIRNLETEHTVDLAQIHKLHEEVSWMEQLIFMMADLMKGEGIQLPDEVQEYLARKRRRPFVLVDGELPVVAAQMLDRFFDNEELQGLVYDLGADWDNLSGDTKAVKARSLVDFFVKRGQLRVLIEEIQERRPHAWPPGYGQV